MSSVPLFARNNCLQPVRRPVRGEDLTLYAAIVGKPAKVDPLPDEPRQKLATGRDSAESAGNFISIVRRRKPPRTPWSPAILSQRLRDICHGTIAVRVKRPQMAGWLHHISDEAIRRLEQAQIRLSATRPSRSPGRKKVDSREVPAGR